MRAVLSAEPAWIQGLQAGELSVGMGYDKGMHQGVTPELVCRMSSTIYYGATDIMFYNIPGIAI